MNGRGDINKKNKTIFTFEVKKKKKVLKRTNPITFMFHKSASDFKLIFHLRRLSQVSLDQTRLNHQITSKLRHLLCIQTTKKLHVLHFHIPTDTSQRHVTLSPPLGAFLAKTSVCSTNSSIKRMDGKQRSPPSAPPHTSNVIIRLYDEITQLKL